MSLLKSSNALTGQQQQLPRCSKPAVQRGMLVVRRFRNNDDIRKNDDERMRQLAQLPEQPITMRHPPPSADLADIIPNPGQPQ